MASLSSYAFQVKLSIQRKDSISHNFNNSKTTLVSSFKPFLRKLGQIPVQVDEIPRMLKNTSIELLNAFVDSTFEFVEQPILPSQSNFAPVEEIGNLIVVNNVEGRVPADFPEGIYARNGSNPLFGGLQSSHSIFGRSHNIWVEGEGMIHAIYFNKESDGKWSISYNNRYVETETFKFEKSRKRPSFIPAVEGNPRAILSASLLNMSGEASIEYIRQAGSSHYWLRFGRVNKDYSNTNIFEHAGKFYSISEADLPQEIDLLTLETLGSWDVNGAWNRPFFSHPKKAPGTGELVTMGVDGKTPFHELGVISADGELVHKVDLKFKRCTLCHDLGVTRRYNVILDFPFVLDINRVINGGPFIKYDETDYARIGVMPRYGDSDSIKWFDVKASSAFHIFNCFEDGDEVVMWACRARGSVLPGPDFGIEKFEYFYRGFKHVKSIKQNTNSKLTEGLFFTRAYEWRLNMQTGEVKERHLTGTNYSMDFPMINDKFVGLKNKFGYTQVVDSEESSNAGIAKYGGLAKLHFEEISHENAEEVIKVEYHIFPKNTFCSGSAFVSKIGGLEEDDGFIVTFVHNEDSNISQVYVIDAKKFSDEPVTIITLPSRVPYGFHGVFMSMTPCLQQLPGNA